MGLKRLAAMCILRCGDQYMLLERAKNPNKGLYVPVGGKLEPFENPHNAARRETLEETGIEVNDFKFCGTLVETAPVNYNWVCYVYIADIPYQDIPFCDEGQLHWVKHTDLPNTPMPPTDYYIFDYITAGKPFAFSADFDENLNMIALREEIEGVIFDLPAID